MTADRFETIPAWRIGRLRAALRDAEARGGDPTDTGEDLVHRAAQRRFRMGRARLRSAPAGRSRATRKGRRFPVPKLVVIWQAILTHRPAGWRSGDRAPSGSIRRAHEEAVRGCRAAGLVPPRYRTVYVLWHRGAPPPAVLALLDREAERDAPPAAEAL